MARLEISSVVSMAEVLVLLRLDTTRDVALQPYMLDALGSPAPACALALGI